MDLEEIWRIREEEVYPRLFGHEQRGIFALTADIFAKQFSRPSVDPRWLFHGVIEFAPTGERPCWLYVTSGCSNPWMQEPDAYDAAGSSGSGVELVFASTEQGDWAVSFLQSMLAFELLLNAGCFPHRERLTLGDRIPLGGPINGVEECLLRNAIVAEPAGLPARFALPSGHADFLAFAAATEGELAFAKINSSSALIERLSSAGYFPISDPTRQSLF